MKNRRRGIDFRGYRGMIETLDTEVEIAMPVSSAVRKELETEQERLELQLDRLNAQAEAVKRRYLAVTEVLNDDPTTIAANNGFGDMGLRDAMRSVLAEAGALKAGKVARILASRGFQFSGKTKPAVRVANDLWKMADAGQLVKNDNSEYSLAEDE